MRPSRSTFPATTPTPVSSLVLVNAMVPVPGETPGEWWANTGAVEAREVAADAGNYGDYLLQQP